MKISEEWREPNSKQAQAVGRGRALAELMPARFQLRRHFFCFASA